MIDVEICHIKDKYAIRGFGHAEYAVHGKDIVCAAFSTLLETFAYYLEEQPQEGWKLEKEDLSPGHIVLEYLDFSHKFDTNFKMVKLGIECLAQTYPDYVNVIYKTH